jgi:glycosyltransferase involved in cell wall biosynthesis
MTAAGAPHVVLVTPGHLSTNPRLVKEADALAQAGLRVTVVAARFIGWADRTDQEFERRPWAVHKVAFGRMAGRPAHLVQAVRQRLARRVFGATGRCAPAAHHPASAALVRAACAIPADLYIAHNLAALPAAFAAARRHGARLGFDAEDFHRGEFPDGDTGSLPLKLTRALESAFIPHCDHLTAASPGIARAYAEACAVREPEVILNVFDAPAAAGASDQPAREAAPRLYWFSQTLGPDRGLEAAVEALALARCKPSLALRGNPVPGFEAHLLALAGQHGVAERLELLPTAPPHEMVALASQYDVGLAIEPGHTENNRRCLTNKLFTFLVAGVPVLASPTPAQVEFARGEPAVRLCERHDAAALAAAIDELWLDAAGLAQARAAAKQAAGRYNWQRESARFVELVKACLCQPPRAKARPGVERA